MGKFLFSIFILLTWGNNAMSQASIASTIPVAAPMNSDSAGQIGVVAVRSVVRVVCPQQNSAGTAFLHKSGRLLTAEHVVRGCSEPILILANAATIKATIVATDADSDLAILNPESPITASALTISKLSDFVIGAQVTTWGFPNGYANLIPMLSVGYLAGSQQLKTESGKFVLRYVVNAAFNAGNSGGPLVHVETGEVMGIVSSKLAPISETAMSALQSLQVQNSGFIYSATKPDGSTFQISEGQIVATVLDELRKQVQLVIGMATPNQDIRTFLTKNGIDP